MKLEFEFFSLDILHDFTLFIIDIYQNMLISLFPTPTPFDHFHFHPNASVLNAQKL